MPSSTKMLIALGEAIRKRRESLGLSQVELAVKTGIARTYLCDVERAKRNISVINLSKIALALKVGPSKLMRLAEANAAET